MSGDLCTGTRRDGTECRARSLPDSAQCFAHDPRMADTMRKAKSNGGKGTRIAVRLMKALPPDLSALTDKLEELMDKVESAAVRPREAEVIGGLVGRWLDVRKYAREEAEAEQLTKRVAELAEQVAVLKRMAG